MVCDFSFQERYGPLGQDFIHVHHMIELSLVPPGYQVDPIADLRPVCPNCHAMLHRTRPAVTIEALKKILRKLTSEPAMVAVRPRTHLFVVVAKCGPTCEAEPRRTIWNTHRTIS